MKNDKPTARKPLKLELETIQHLDSNILDNVRGGEGEQAAIAGPTALDHSCNVACGPAV